VPKRDLISQNIESRYEKLEFLDLAVWGKEKKQKYLLSTDNISFYCYFDTSKTSESERKHTFHSDNKQLNSIVDLIIKHSEKTKNIKEELEKYSQFLDKILDLKPTKKQVEKLLENQNLISKNFDYIKEQNTQLEKSLRKTVKLEDSINTLLVEIQQARPKEVELRTLKIAEQNSKAIEKFEQEIKDLREILEFLKHQAT
ncbi:ORF P24 [Rice tungro bacilliform virus]|uniref:Protein P1 n=2 Tax=Rice tungro bacilliform virus TaxID=10654 RepID=P1_RTBVP